MHKVFPWRYFYWNNAVKFNWEDGNSVKMMTSMKTIMSLISINRFLIRWHKKGWIQLTKVLSDILLKLRFSIISKIVDNSSVPLPFTRIWKSLLGIGLVLIRAATLKQKQPSSVLKKRCSENMQQIYRRASMPKSHFGMGALL